MVLRRGTFVNKEVVGKTSLRNLKESCSVFWDCVGYWSQNGGQLLSKFECGFAYRAENRTNRKTLFMEARASIRPREARKYDAIFRSDFDRVLSKLGLCRQKDIVLTLIAKPSCQVALIAKPK